MDLIKYSLEKPVSVTVGVILILVFGVIGLINLPVQLTPDVETPEITVKTSWGGATPYEIEKEIIEQQEEVLKGLQGLTRMESSSYNGYGEISLSFELDVSLDDALLRVSNKINEVPNYPENVNRPVIESAGANASPVIWMMLKPLSENSQSINHYRSYFEDNVRQHLERVKGVGSLFIFGGTFSELHITLDMDKMASYNVSINQVISAVRNSNQTSSAGVLGMGRKNYRIRTMGQFQTPADALGVVVFDDGMQRVYLKDIAAVDMGYAKESIAVQHSGEAVIVIGVRKEPGTNVLAMSERLEHEVDELNSHVLAAQGLYIDWVYDQRPYINTAIDLVKKNVAIGGLLAICVLLVFLRSIRSTVITAVAIPISAIGTFIFLWITGRNINVVSLAGISFAVGMLVDNSIVVLENIDRHRKMGKPVYEAAWEGTREVWGAVLASTATTVAVFLPIIFMQEEAGQLFRDIAIAITFSILISLFVSVSVIPSLTYQLYKNRELKPQNRLQKSVVGPFLSDLVMRASGLCLKSVMSRLVTVFSFLALSVGLVFLLLPSTEYLPQGNRNLILNILIPPPGYSVAKMQELGDFIHKEAEPYFKEDGKDGIPQIKDMFFVGADRFTLFGGISTHDTRAAEMMPLFRRIMGAIPGVFGVSLQTGIFENGIGEGRTVDVNIAGEDINAIVAAGRVLYGSISGAIQGAQVRPVPSLETSYPEIQVIPNKERLASSGMTEKDLGTYIDILMDGRKIDEYRPQGSKQKDLVLTGNNSVFGNPESILKAPIVNGYGSLIRVGDVAALVYSEGMPQINHLERKRTITLQVTPPQDIPLQDAMDTISQEVVAPLITAGQLAGVTVTIGGNADKLTEARKALQWNLLLALLITYLLMAALFENFLYPLIIMFSIPLAAAGGFVGLSAVNTFIAPQGFDVLAMLGFIILVGTVVNNAILIVHQSLNNVRYGGMQGVAAISEAVRTRIRPIFMSATTSVLGMLPLVLSTGSGSELYRGLGAILLGGLALSTLLTLLVIPALLAFVINFERSRVDETI